MKKNNYILLSAFVFCVVACSKSNTGDDIMTHVSFRIILPKNVKIEKMNAELKCINVNTKEEIKKTGINGLSFQERMIKGFYIIHLDGVIIYKKDNSSQKTVKKIRGYIDDAMLLGHKQECKIPILFLTI